jgi:hypothetical protein
MLITLSAKSGREFKMDIEKELSENQAILIVMQGLNYSKLTSDVTKKLSEKRVCFATLNKTYPAVEEWLNKSGCDTKNFFFIDAISRALKDVKGQKKKCSFVGTPSALTELSIAISDNLSNFDYLVFDSVSTLTIYNKVGAVEKFTSSIVNKIREAKVKSIFFILEGDKTIGAMSMVFDKVLELKGG